MVKPTVRPWKEWTEEEKGRWLDSFSDTLVESFKYLVEHNIPIPSWRKGNDRTF